MKRGPPILSSRFLRQRPFTSPPSATSLQNSKYPPVNMLPILTPGREGPRIEIEHVAALQSFVQSFVPRRLRLVAHLFQQAPGRVRTSLVRTKDGEGWWTIVQSQSGMARSSASRAKQIGPFDDGEEKRESCSLPGCVFRCQPCSFSDRNP